MGRKNRKHRAATAARLAREREEQRNIDAYRACGEMCDPEEAEQARRDRINEERGLHAAPYDDEVATFRARA